MSTTDIMRAFFEHITIGLKGTETEKIKQVIDNLDLLPLDLEPFKDIIAFNQDTLKIKLTMFNGNKPQVINFDLKELPNLLERVRAITKQKLPYEPRWKTLNKRSDQLQKDYLELQNKLFLDDPDDIEDELFKEDTQELMGISKLPNSEQLRGYGHRTMDKIYLLQNVIPLN